MAGTLIANRVSIRETVLMLSRASTITGQKAKTTATNNLFELEVFG
jgi:hypothetical protein